MNKEIKELYKYIIFIMHKVFQLSTKPTKECLETIKSDTLTLIKDIGNKYDIDVEHITYRKEWRLVER